MIPAGRYAAHGFSPRVLVVNANPGSRMDISSVLFKARFDVVACATGAEGLALFKLAPSSALVVDYQLADMGGVDFIHECAKQGMSPARIMTMSKGEIPAAVQALKEGISDFLPEPYDHRLAQSLRQVLREAANKDRPDRDACA